MFIKLETHWVWKLEGDSPPEQLLMAMGTLFGAEDRLVLGSYSLPDHVRSWLLTKHQEPKQKIYDDWCFDANRNEYPSGRSYCLSVEKQSLEMLTEFYKEAAAGKNAEYPVLFDHLLVYRPGVPILPLLDYHDAFRGGVLYLSGHYLESEINAFGALLNDKPVRIVFPPFASP
jgi:hypothetical protein